MWLQKYVVALVAIVPSGRSQQQNPSCLWSLAAQPAGVALEIATPDSAAGVHQLPRYVALRYIKPCVNCSHAALHTKYCMTITVVL